MNSDIFSGNENFFAEDTNVHIDKNNRGEVPNTEVLIRSIVLRFSAKRSYLSIINITKHQYDYKTSNEYYLSQ